jgi:hypothetical protein
MRQLFAAWTSQQTAGFASGKVRGSPALTPLPVIFTPTAQLGVTTATRFTACRRNPLICLTLCFAKRFGCRYSIYV